MATESSTSGHTPRGPKLVSLKKEGVERKLAMTFGFMSFIPILIVVWAMVYRADLGVALYAIVASVFIGYFAVARRTMRSVLKVAEHARMIASGQSLAAIDDTEQNEIGE